MNRMIEVVLIMCIIGSMFCLVSCISENKADKVIYVTNVDMDFDEEASLIGGK